MTRTFTSRDQERFAALSGDYNPIHMDTVAARRLLFGRPVVHGIHALLWGLDEGLAASGSPLRIGALKAAFAAPVFLDEPVELTVKHPAPRSLRLEVTRGGANALQATIDWREEVDDAEPLDSTSPGRTPCRAWTSADIEQASGELPLQMDSALAAELFPAAARRLNRQQLASLLALTRMVGMHAPGEHSLFLGLALSEAKSSANRLSYAVEAFDERLSLVAIRVRSSGFEGSVSAALRPAPAALPCFAEAARLVAPGEFSGERALIVGGSRGLGAAAVNTLAAGGAEVRFTYHQGIEDAQRLSRDLPADVRFFRFDAAADGADLARMLEGWQPTLLCYFATPFAAASQGRFSAGLYQRFSAIYVHGFLETFHALSQPGTPLRNVLYPSSIFVDELPAGMAEYAAAKAAAETLCRYLGKRHKRICFYTPRLPRLATDQTASLLPVETADPQETILRVLREIYAPPRAKEMAK